MSDLLDSIREKYPQYKDVSDDDLTLAIGQKYPVYLSQDEDFKKQFDGVVSQSNPRSPNFNLNRAADALKADDIEAPFHVAPAEEPLGQIDVAKPVNKAMEHLGRGLVGTANAFAKGEAWLLGRKISPDNPYLLKYGEPVGPDLMKPLTEEEQSSLPPLASGTYNATKKAVDALRTPEMIGTLPLLPLKPVQALLVGQMAANMPDQATRAIDVLDDPNASDREKVEAVADLGIAGTMTGLGAKHLLKKGVPNAEGIRSNQGQPIEPGGVGQTSEVNRGGNLEQTPPIEPQSVDQGEQPQAQPNVPTEVAPPAEPPPNQIQVGRPTGGGLKLKWTEATNPDIGEAGFINIDPLRDLFEGIGRGVKESIQAVRDAGKEALDPKRMNDYRRSVLNWSGSLQKSFQEASDAQREIKSEVKDPIRRDGITNWIQAGGDRTILQNRAAATTDPKLKKGYEAALNLTPDEIRVANDVKSAYDALGLRGQHYDVLNNFRDNYVTQIWDLKKGPTGGASSRTLRDKFRFSRARTFDSFFDGEQAGFKPKTKDIAKILPAYIHEMNSVIAARQLVQRMSKGVASDGMPLLAPRGVGVSVDDATGKATLVMPNAIKGDTLDYKTLDSQPALSSWRWAAKDDAGNPVFLKGELAVHPEVYDKLKNVLGKSAIKEWYDSKGSFATAIPKAIVKAIDVGQGEIKRTMLGFFAPFHQFQEGTHAIGHRVNPIAVTRGGLVDRVTGGKLPDALTIPKIDLVNNPAHLDAAKHGLMLQPDRASQETFMDGFRHSGLVSRIPILGPAADFYSHYLFHEYIPGLKYKTYEAILERNQKVFAKDLASGKVKPEDVKVISAEQANAAYGHLNYADLGRNPTILHLMRLGLLAPDFLEARARFVGQSIKGATGANVGREQILALATLAISQVALAYVGSKLTDGDWDAKHPFEFTSGNRRYGLRSVPEDVFRLMTDSRAFVYSRLSPTIGRGAIQYASGVDWRGIKKTPLETTKELAQQPIPLTARGFLGIGNTPLSAWEQLAGAVGLKISRYSAQSDVYKLVDDFKKNSGNAKLVAEYERRQKETYADSDYKPLRVALEKGDAKEAESAYAELLKTKKRSDIDKAMRPYSMVKISGTDLFEKHDKPFTGSRKFESAFVKSLDSDGKQAYARARQERVEEYTRFKQFLKERNKSSQ